MSERSLGLRIKNHFLNKSLLFPWWGGCFEDIGCLTYIFICLFGLVILERWLIICIAKYLVFLAIPTKVSKSSISLWEQKILFTFPHSQKRELWARRSKYWDTGYHNLGMFPQPQRLVPQSQTLGLFVSKSIQKFTWSQIALILNTHTQNRNGDTKYLIHLPRIRY